MKQKQLEIKKEELTSDETLKKKFEETKNMQTYRMVRLVYKSCCGCGCSDIDVQRKVPFDSPLQDGSRIKKIEEDDEVL